MQLIASAHVAGRDAIVRDDGLHSALLRNLERDGRSGRQHHWSQRQWSLIDWSQEEALYRWMYHATATRERVCC